MNFKMKTKTLSDIIIDNKKSTEKVCINKCIEAILEESNLSESDVESESIEKLKQLLHFTYIKIIKKLNESYRNKLTYETRNVSFLNSEFKYELKQFKSKRKLSFESSESSSSAGRPPGSSSKTFSELGRTQKWRKTSELASKHEFPELISASVKTIKDHDLRYILKMSPRKWKRIREGNISIILYIYI